MITIDRSSSNPVGDQVATQLRFLIATGRFDEGESLPSTRALARQTGVSFHTIRKVYQVLADEGLLASRPGSGYVVVRRAPEGKEVRMERGAEIANEALLRMAALGLNEADVAYLFDEQRSLLEAQHVTPKIVMAAPYLELAERCADHMADRLQFDVEAVRLADIHRHADADFIITPYPFVRSTLLLGFDADVIGMEVGLGSELLDAVSRLSDESTLGLLVTEQETVAPLMSALRDASGFSGGVVAVSIHDDTIELLRRLRDCEVVVVSPGVRRRVPGSLRKEKRIVTVDGRPTEESLARVRAALPR
jgi:DNA-binding transcriptional regulator YhcF (GntR family)